MLYTLICPRCADNTTISAAHDEPTDTVYDCDFCGAPLCRRDNRNWSADLPEMQGETVAGGCNYSGWDDGLQCHVSGKAHRDRIMKERGLVPFSPNPINENARDTTRHILKNSRPGDPEARAAIHKEQKHADRMVKQKMIKERFDKVKLAGP